MRKIEREEERVGANDPDKPCFHLCIVNLVIGTLYCAKGNYEFGISRIIKSLDPYVVSAGASSVCVSVCLSVCVSVRTPEYYMEWR